MNFAEILATLPAADHLRGLDVVDASGAVVHHIPAAPGKMGSLRLYNALAEKFGGALNGDVWRRASPGLPSTWSTRVRGPARTPTSICCWTLKRPVKAGGWCRCRPDRRLMGK